MCLLGGGDGIQESDGGRDVDSSPEWEIDFRDQHGGGDNNAVEGEGDNVSHDLAHEEESVDHVQPLPQRVHLHTNPIILPSA